MTDQPAGNLALAAVFPDRQPSFVIESSWQAMMVLSGVSDIIEPKLKISGSNSFGLFSIPSYFFHSFEGVKHGMATTYSPTRAPEPRIPSDHS
jgi:hypothetical protein